MSGTCKSLKERHCVLLVAYENTLIEVIGYFVAELTFQGISTVAKVYVTKDGSCLLGWPQQKELQITLHPNHPGNVPS